MRAVQRAIGFLITRALRSRLGAAVALAVVVVGILGAARLVTGPDSRPAVVGQPHRPITTVNPTAGDDGLSGDAGPATPRVSPGAERPEVVARAFAAAWLERDRSAAGWQAALAPRSTPALAQRLSGVDPAGVPAQRITGEPVLTPQTADLAEVSLPVDTGTLRLQLVGDGGVWRVDEIDWERS
ncbi:hypothetical protein [Plantactinospora sp. KBS50]|uniref:hypothetical protein n=1 Tax=Plantactinospora sp. KBS50 TaxID=2024580 RepID=UPI000BAAA45F|nr:hypothetical protein [Plantactinospora sp. KBS50]ASW57024.1 hypothetical protein CIK06_27040 [Plantactinospora sp. KBS50]